MLDLKQHSDSTLFADACCRKRRQAQIAQGRWRHGRKALISRARLDSSSVCCYLRGTSAVHIYLSASVECVNKAPYLGLQNGPGSSAATFACLGKLRKTSFWLLI